MTIDALTVASQELETDVMKEPELAPQEEALLEIEPAVEELEPEEPASEVLDADSQEVDDDPVRLYLHEIGRVPLLTALDENVFPQSNISLKCRVIVLLPARFSRK
jgi:hypothetical protein